MKYTIINRSAVTVLTLSTFLTTASLAFAENIVLPPHFIHAGLAFAPPITFDQPKQMEVPVTNVEFRALETLELNNEKNKKEALGNMILTPTLASDKSQTSQIMPTPTLYFAPPLSETTETQSSPPPTSKLYTPNPVTPTLAPTSAPVVTQTANVGGLSSDKLFDMSNAYRQSKGLAPFEKDERTCSLAASRAPEINAEIASGAMHSGLRSRALPYWNSENIISMNSEDAAFNWWINDTIHREAIEGNYKYSCTACAGNACAQEFTNYQPK